MTHPILTILRGVDAAGVNGLAVSSGTDPREVRIALLAASADGLVEVDGSFQKWRLTARGRNAVDTVEPGTSA